MGVPSGHAHDVSEPTRGAEVDPLTGALALMLVVPLWELYAVLWRAGVVEIVD